MVVHSDMEVKKKRGKKRRKGEEESRRPVGQGGPKAKVPGGKGGPKAKGQEDKMIKERKEVWQRKERMND